MHQQRRTLQLIGIAAGVPPVLIGFGPDCRIIISKPKLVIMDEATSALDTDNEALLYQALKGQGVTFVSVGHRPTLSAFHEQQLQLQPVSTGNAISGIDWKISAVDEAAAKF